MAQAECPSTALTLGSLSRSPWNRSLAGTSNPSENCMGVRPDTGMGTALGFLPCPSLWSLQPQQGNRGATCHSADVSLQLELSSRAHCWRGSPGSSIMCFFWVGWLNSESDRSAGCICNPACRARLWWWCLCCETIPEYVRPWKRHIWWHLLEAFQYLKGTDCSKAGEGAVTRTCSDRTWGSDLKLEEDRFKLDI